MRREKTDGKLEETCVPPTVPDGIYSTLGFLSGGEGFIAGCQIALLVVRQHKAIIQAIRSLSLCASIVFIE